MSHPSRTTREQKPPESNKSVRWNVEVSTLVVHLCPALRRLRTVCLFIGLLMHLTLVSLWVVFGLQC
jgi:hypothetical protein